MTEQIEELSIYAKLMKARVMLQGKKLSKSGHNKFAGYKYFELGDFLPAVQEIFFEIGLCGFVTFGPEIAELFVVDIDSEEKIVFTSPMATASLKGAHDIQNLGAVQTYLRRYLWVTAMEIVEHDALDAALGEPEEASTRQPAQRRSRAAEAPKPQVEEKNDQEDKEADDFASVAYEKMDSIGLSGMGVKTLLAVLGVEQLQQVNPKHRKQLLSRLTDDYAKLLNVGKNSKGEQILSLPVDELDGSAPSIDELEKELNAAF